MKEKPKIGKLFRGIIIAILVVIIAFAVLVIALTFKPSSNSSQTITQTNEVEENPYLDVEITKENQYDVGTVSSTKISLNDKNFKKFIKLANKQDLNFTYDEYFQLEDVLKKDYIKRGKLEYNTEVLNSNGEFDADKLVEASINNLDSRETNIFCKELEKSKVREICELLAKILNENKDKYDVNEMATMLSNLRVLERPSSTAYAYVTKDIDLVVNPALIKTKENISVIKGEKYDVYQATIVHEIMHLMQYAASYDGDNTVVDKIGFCRREESRSEKANPLFDKWIIEGSAETLAQAYYGFPESAMTYKANIKFANSVLMTHMFDKGFDRHLLEKTTLSDDIYETFDIMNISDKAEQIEFLKLLYCISVARECDEGFYTYYSAQTGEDATDQQSEERAKIINVATADSYKFITNKFYKSLAEYVNQNDVDLETVFFLARCHEIDTSFQLQYDKKDTFDFNKSAILNHYELQQALFEAIANSSDMTLDEINKAYDKYKLYVTDENKNEFINCNWNLFSDDQKDFIDFTKNLFSYTRFVRLRTMVDYINQK